MVPSTVTLTCPLGSRDWLTFTLTVHTHHTDAVLSVGQQVYVQLQGQVQHQNSDCFCTIEF